MLPFTKVVEAAPAPEEEFLRCGGTYDIVLLGG